VNYQTLKKILAKIRRLPLHPQWFAFRHEVQQYLDIGQQVTGRVLDIGCANQYMKTYLRAASDYIGLDYYQTAVQWYATRPQVYGDAQQLPFRENSMDAVLLLDVLEHLPRPADCLREIARVLKPTGILVLKVPFLYPLHDAPLDFHRWTHFGLQQFVQQHGFRLRQITPIGKPLETAGLLANIAISKTVLNWIQQRSPALILGIFTPLVILTINLLCWLINLLSPEDNLMPHSYRLVLEKTENQEFKAEL
jgi:ubiquinone/menaquinone biosynthesis C-methylase UbiE